MATKVTFAQAVKLGFKNYATFRGVASRSEFWYLLLFYVLVNAVSSMLDTLLEQLAGLSLQFGISDILGLAMLLPLLAVTARRFKDAGFSAWLLWLQAIPTGLFIGFLIALVASPPAFDFLNLIATDPNNLPSEEEIAVILGSIDPNIFMGLGISLLLALGWSLFQFIVELLPSKTKSQGNKYAPESGSDLPGTTA